MLIVESGPQRGLARRVLAEAGLQHAAEHDLVDVLGRDSRSFQRGTDRIAAEGGSPDILEVAAERAHRRPYGADDVRLLHVPISPSLGSAVRGSAGAAGPSAST